MIRLNLIRIPDNTKISMNSSSLLNPIYSFFIYLLFIISFCNVISFGVNAQQTDSDGTIAIPFMQWVNYKSQLTGTPPPGLKDFAFGYSKEYNIAVIFGGTTPGGTKSGATYLIDFTNNKWALPTDYGLTSPQPEPRSNMIYGVDKSSSYRNAFIISCGAGSGGVLYNDVWAFDFIYKIWTKVTNVTGESPPPLMNSFGGIDITLAIPSQTVQPNTLWASHGTNGTHFFTDLYALLIDGTFSPNNLNNLNAVWYKVPVSGDIPSGRLGVAGTALPKRLAMYGGCDKLGGNCATLDSYSLDLGSNYVNGKVSSAQPLWSKKNSCLGERFGAAMAMNSNPSQVIVYGGASADLKAVGVPGEIGVLDTDVGNWVRVLPQNDSVSGYPPQSTGAQMAPISAIGDPKVTKILLFGGELLDGTNSNLNDIWMLVLDNNLTSGNTVKSSPQIKSMEFLKCVQPKQPSSTTKLPSPTGTNVGSTSDEDVQNFPSNHVTFSTISIACLPLATSVIRFGYGSNKKWAIAGLYTLFIVASYATAFYGFAIAFDNRQNHFSTLHGKLGITLLIFLYIIVPSLAIISLYISKKYDSDLNLDNDSDNDKGGSKPGFFNWRNSESNSKPIKSFEVSRPGNRLLPEGEQSFPASVLKSSDNWMEKRKSVTIAENHPTMSSQGSRNNSLQNGPSSRRTSQSTAVSRSGLQTSTAPSSNHSSSIVVITRHIHHVVAQSILLLTIIYIGIYLIKKKIVDPLSFYIFIGFTAIIYLIWIIAAWYGYPKGRNSLLVLFMHKIACGKGERNEMKQYNYEDSYGNGGGTGAMSTPSTNRRLRIEDDDMDEEAEQAQLEHDMHNREVVVMTIPKRRLTVVNA